MKLRLVQGYPADTVMSVLEPGQSGLRIHVFKCPSVAEGLECEALAVETRQGEQGQACLVSGLIARSQVSREGECVGDRVGCSLGLPLWPLGCFLRPNRPQALSPS